MKAPDKIYVAEGEKTEVGLFGLWTDKDHRDTPYCQYIRKDAILKWVKEQEAELEYGISADAFQLALTMLKEKLESL